MDLLVGKFNYLIYVVLMMIGLYAAMAKQNLVKKVLGLSLFQTGIFIFYISLGVVDAGTVPIRWEKDDPWRIRFQATHLRHLLESDDVETGLPALHQDERQRALQALARDGAQAAVDSLPELPPEQLARVRHLVPPPLAEGDERSADIPYTNPLPGVLILTAIVVSVSTMAVALAIVVNIRRRFGTLEADEIALLCEQEEPAR